MMCRPAAQQSPSSGAPIRSTQPCVDRPLDDAVDLATAENQDRQRRQLLERFFDDRRDRDVDHPVTVLRPHQRTADVVEGDDAQWRTSSPLEDERQQCRRLPAPKNTPSPATTIQ